MSVRSRVSASRLFRLIAFCLLITALAALAPGLQAQTAHFSYAQANVAGGLYFPAGVAVDGSGNVYIADRSNDRVLKETPSNGGYTQTVVANGLNGPYGVAVDSNGNVYIANTFDGQIVEATPAGSSYTVNTIISNLGDPYGIAVDAADNLYVSTVNTSSIGEELKETLSGSAYTQTIIATGLSKPFGVAVDAAGNIYVADQDADDVLKLSGPTYTQSTIASGLNAPDGVTVDSSGNVYITDTQSSQVLEETVSGSNYTQTTLPITGLNEPFGLALDSSGNLYIADFHNDRVLRETLSGGVNLGSEQIGVSSATVSLIFSFDSAGTIGTPSVVTQGAPNLDFTDAGTGTCDTNGTSKSYNTGDACTVDVTFKPTAPGTRYGAVVLSNASGTPIATAYVFGTGIGPLANFPPGTQSTITTISGAGSLAVDENLNLYVVNDLNPQVTKLPWTGSSYGSPVTLGTSLSELEGVAVDGAGNVFVSDAGNGNVVEIPWTGTGYGAQRIVASGLSHPVPVTVDGSGNLYVGIVSLTGNDSVIKIAWTGSGYGTPATLTTQVSYPEALAVDGAGDVFIADEANNRVVELPWTDGGYGALAIVDRGVSSPHGVAVDPAGNLYIADTGNQRVVEMPWIGGSYGTQSTIASGVGEVVGVKLDDLGDLYYIDAAYGYTNKLDLADPPSLHFNNASVDMQSGDSPQSFTLMNAGNAALTFPIPGSGNSPGITSSTAKPSFTLDSSSTCPLVSSSSGAAGSLAANTSCNYAVNFIPQAGGSITGTLTLTDNNLNAASPSYAKQAISLSGTGVAITLLPASLPGGAYGTAYSTQTLSAGGGTAPYNYSVTAGSLPPGLSLSTGGSLFGTPSATGSFPFTLTATDTSTGGGPYSGSQSYTVNIAQAPLTVMVKNATKVYGTANPAFTGTVSALVNGDTAASIGLAYTTTATVSSPAAQYPITATVTSGDYALSVTPGALNITQAATSTALTASSASVNPGQNVILTATITDASAESAGTPTGTVSFYNGTTLLGTSTLTAGVATLSTTALSAGANSSITASYSGDTNFLPSATIAATPIAVAPLDFTFAATGQTSQTVAAGGSTSYQVVVAPLYGNYPGKVTFTASGLPSGASCTFNPATIAANGGQQTVTLTIQTAATTALEGTPPLARKLAPLSLVLLLPLFGFGTMRRRGRMLKRMLCLLILVGGIAATATISGCGSNNSTPDQTTTTYNITVTATAGSIQHTAAVKLGVK